MRYTFFSTMSRVDNMSQISFYPSSYHFPKDITSPRLWFKLGTLEGPSEIVNENENDHMVLHTMLENLGFRSFRIVPEPRPYINRRYL